MSSRLDVELKEADHVQAILARYDQGLIALKTGYFACLYALLSGGIKGGLADHRPITIFVAALFFWLMDIGLRYRFWASWAHRATEISAIWFKRYGTYELIKHGSSPLELTRSRRLEMAFNTPDMVFYFFPAVLYLIATHCFGWSL